MLLPVDSFCSLSLPFNFIYDAVVNTGVKNTCFLTKSIGIFLLDSGIAWTCKRAFPTAKADPCSPALKSCSLKVLIFTFKYLMEPHFILKMM